MLSAQLADPSVTPAVHRAVTGALAVLAGAGWRLREIRAPWLDRLAAWEDTLAAIVTAEAAAVHRGRDWDGTPRAPGPCSVTARPSPAINLRQQNDSAQNCPPRSRRV